MFDPQALLPVPEGTPVWLGSWLSAGFQYALAPALVGLLVARAASGQTRKAAMSEKQKMGARLIDELSQFGRRVDERLRDCDLALNGGGLAGVPILEDLAVPELREASATLGPKVAMQHQMLKDSFGAAAEELTYLRRIWNEALIKGEVGDVATPLRLAVAPIEDVLIHIYRSMNLAARAARLPYKLNARIPLSTLEARKRTHLRLVLHPPKPPTTVAANGLVRQLMGKRQRRSS